ncbi:MAG: archease [Nitrosopumilaceae archaeon]
MSIRYLEHATDAFIEVRGSNLQEAFIKAGESVVDTTLERSTVSEKEQRTLKVSGRKLHHILFNWLEEVNFQLVTEGFAIARFELELRKNSEYSIEATAFGEPIDLKKHHFKVEIKAPTFHLMEITENDGVLMRFLLDL